MTKEKSPKPKKEKPMWMNHEGVPVPDSAVSPFDKRKEPKIKAMLKIAEKLRKLEEETEKYIRETSDALMAEMYGNRQKKYDGNESFTLYSYDKSIRVTARKNSALQIGPEINIAYKMFNEYLDSVLTDGSQDLRQLVMRAFSTSKGELDPKRLVSLMSYKIENPKWQIACDTLKESISTIQTKRSFKIAVRDSEGEYIDV